MLEETHVCFIETFQNLLNRLGMQQATSDVLHKVRFHPSNTNILVVYLVVAFLQGKGMVPYKCSLTKHLIQMFRLISSIQLVFVCNHSAKIQKICEIYKKNLLIVGFFLTFNRVSTCYHPILKGMGIRAGVIIIVQFNGRSRPP